MIDHNQSRYTIIEKVGSGSYGVVYKARDKQSDRIVAIKRFKSDGAQGCDHSILREIVNLQRIKNDHVLELLDVYYDESLDGTKYFLVFPFYESDLSKYLHDSTNQIRPHLRQFFSQILQGLKSIHQQAILHRDIKPSNILITDTLTLKIADFGLSRPLCLPGMQELTSEVMTLSYRAPEILLGSTKYGYTADIWSLGCVFAYMTLGYPLFEENTQIALLFNIFRMMGSPSATYSSSLAQLPLFRTALFPRYKPKQNVDKLLEELCKTVGQEGAAMIVSMLQIDPDSRPSCQVLLESNYFQH